MEDTKLRRPRDILSLAKSFPRENYLGIRDFVLISLNYLGI
jgi:hypothetical protein